VEPDEPLDELVEPDELEADPEELEADPEELEAEPAVPEDDEDGVVVVPPPVVPLFFDPHEIAIGNARATQGHHSRSCILDIRASFKGWEKSGATPAPLQDDPYGDPPRVIRTR
jgi:hypothetical protein